MGRRKRSKTGGREECSVGRAEEDRGMSVMRDKKRGRQLDEQTEEVEQRGGKERRIERRRNQRKEQRDRKE